MQDLRTSTLIRNGLKHLWDGQDIWAISDDKKEEYLCHAIARAVRNDDAMWHLSKASSNEEATLNRVRTMIEGRLFPYNNLYAWLIHQAGVPDSLLTQERLQEHRRKWALKMAAEFKRKGD